MDELFFQIAMRHRELTRTTSEIPPDAIEDTTRLTQENIIYLKGNLLD